MTQIFSDHIKDDNQEGNRILVKLANLTGHDVDADLVDTAGAGNPCGFLKDELRRVQEEDRKRKDLASLKTLPGSVCPGCSLWLKVPAFIFYVCGSVAVVTAVLMLLCKK